MEQQMIESLTSSDWFSLGFLIMIFKRKNDSHQNPRDLMFDSWMDSQGQLKYDFSFKGFQLACSWRKRLEILLAENRRSNTQEHLVWSLTTEYD